MERKTAVWIIVAVVVVAIAAVCLLVGYSLGHKGPTQPSVSVVKQENKSLELAPTRTASFESFVNGATEITPQSFGNLPWDSMSGALTSEEIEAIAGEKLSVSGSLAEVSSLDLPSMARFKRIGFVVCQSYDTANDRKVYWAKDVDVQRFNTFGISSEDKYSFEKYGDFYVCRDFRGRISFFAYGLTTGGEEKKLQSFINVPWGNLSGGIPVDEAARRLTFDFKNRPNSYDLEMKVRQYILTYNYQEYKKRGFQTVERGEFDKLIVSYEGQIYEFEDVLVQPGDYPGGINQIGGTPFFLTMTIKPAESEEKIFVAMFHDREGNLIAAGTIKEMVHPVSALGGGQEGRSGSVYLASGISFSPGGSTGNQNNNNPSGGGGTPSTGRPKI